MHQAGLEPAVSAGEQPQTSFDGAAFGIGYFNIYFRKLLQVVVKINLVQRCKHLDLVMNFRIPEKTRTWTTNRFIT